MRTLQCVKHSCVSSNSLIDHGNSPINTSAANRTAAQTTLFDTGSHEAMEEVRTIKQVSKSPPLRRSTHKRIDGLCNSCCGTSGIETTVWVLISLSSSAKYTRWTSTTSAMQRGETLTLVRGGGAHVMVDPPLLQRSRSPVNIPKTTGFTWSCAILVLCPPRCEGTMIARLELFRIVGGGISRLICGGVRGIVQLSRRESLIEGSMVKNCTGGQTTHTPHWQREVHKNRTFERIG